MKNIISFKVLILLLSITSSIRGQSPLFNYVNDINNNISSIDYIFEGQIQSVVIYAGDEYGNPLTTSNIVWNGDVGYWFDPSSGKQGFGYSLATIKVCKQYKGQIETNEDHFFQVLTRCYAINNVYRKFNNITASYEDKYTYFPSREPLYGIQQEKVFQPANLYPKQIFFCDKIDPIVGSNYFGQNYYYSNFHSLYEMYFNTPINIPQSDGSEIFTDAFCTLFDYAFSDQAELELFLSYITGVNPNPENWCEGSSKPSVPIKNVKAEFDADQNQKNFDEQMQYLIARKNQMKKNSSISPSNKIASPNDLTLDIVNERLSNVGGSNWYEFDIMASANASGLYLDNCLVRINYSTFVFGNNIVSSNNLVVTRSTAFNNSSYLTPVIGNISSSVAGIGLGTISSPSARVLLTTSPQLMLTVRFKIQNCSLPVNISFADQNFTANFCWYAPTVNTPNTSSLVVPFDNVNYNGNIIDNSCTPIISAFTPSIPAGIGRHLQIIGKYFGKVMGNGTVIFKNANYGTEYPVMTQGLHSSGIQPYDVVSWADDEIVLTMPSIIDSGYVLNANNATVQEQICPGSGKFIVKNFTGNKKESSVVLSIPFAMQNVSAPNVAAPTGAYRKKPIYLAAPNSFGYRIQFDPAVTTWNSAAKSVMRRSMKDWSCATEINWRVAGDTVVGLNNNDGICQVMMGPNNMGTKLMSTIPGINTCVFNNVEMWFQKSFDVLINPSPSNGSWWYDTTTALPNPTQLPSNSYDFYQCSSHEFGHGLLVDHINDSLADIMFWGQGAYSYSNGPRKHVWFSFGAEDGGNYATDSLVSGLTCYGNHLPVSASNCGQFVGVKSLRSNLSNLSIYPNPSSAWEDVIIKFDLQREQYVSFNLYGVSGNLIKQTMSEKLGEKIEYNFKTGDISRGIYLLEIKVDNKKQIFKVVKQ